MNDMDRPLAGYRPAAEFLTEQGFPIKTTTLQAYGKPSRAELPIEGYWGRLPIFKPMRLLEWARSRVRPAVRRVGTASAPRTAAAPESAPTAAEAAG